MDFPKLYIVRYKHHLQGYLPNYKMKYGQGLFRFLGKRFKVEEPIEFEPYPPIEICPSFWIFICPITQKEKLYTAITKKRRFVFMIFSIKY